MHFLSAATYVAKNSSCKKWLTQKEIKKIMASENIPFKEAVQFQKTGTVNKAFSFANKAAHKNNIGNIVKGPDTLFSTKKVDISSFPQLAE